MCAAKDYPLVVTMADFEGRRLDYFVSGHGTGGTIAGTGRALREARPEM